MPLELNTLPTIHPRVDILSATGVPCLIRLRLDPTAVGSGMMCREVVIDWRPRPGGTPSKQESREIGWLNLPSGRFSQDNCVRWMRTQNERSITESAAIGVMALLIHDLENAEILGVLQIGNGGDYLVRLAVGEETQAECSGIKVDPSGAKSRNRMDEKCQQVLRNGGGMNGWHRVRCSFFGSP